MSHTTSFRKVTGLSVEKWAAFQLKQLQPRMQTVWDRQHSGTSVVKDKNHNNELVQVLGDIMKIFVEYDVDKTQSITTFSPEGTLDLLRTFAVYYSDCNPTKKQESLEGIHSLSESFFKMLSGALNHEEIISDQTNEDNNMVTNQSSSSLSFLAGFSSLGVEDVAVLLLNNLRTSIEHRFGDILRGILMDDHIMRATQCPEKEQWLREQLQFTTSFLQFTQLVMQFHNNRKKLYTSICEVLLPSTLRLISFCRLLLDESNQAGSNLSSNDNILVVECLAPLYQQLQGVLESGLFDEKAVEEIVTMRLVETERFDSSSSSAHNNNKGKGNKKARKEDAPVVNNDEGEKSSSASVMQQKHNKAFHDVLFRALSTEYFHAEDAAAEDQVPAGCAVASRDDLFARGVAALLELYSRRSHSMAVQCSTQGQGGGRWASAAAGRDEASGGMDAVNTRKHLVRVFHFTFLLLEAFEVSDAGSVSLVESLRMLSSAPLTTSSSGSSKKRKSLGAPISQEGVFSTGADASVRISIKRGLVHNAVLAACVGVMQEQAIPNHDSLQRYVERLHCLSHSRVQQCLSLQALLGENSPAQAAVIAPWVQQLSILDLKCVRAVARIDHTTVVDSQLGSVLRMLAGGDIELLEDHQDGLMKLREAKRDLLFAVLGVHGELRLLDQFVYEAVALEERGLSAWAGRGSLQGDVLREILLSQNASTKLVKLFSGLPTGQGPKLWEYLGRLAGNGQGGDATAVLAEVTTCVLARALMQAHLLTVRSNASVFAASAVDATSTAIEAAVDPTTRHLVSLLWKLTSTVQWAVGAQSSLASQSVVTIVQQGLSTISALLRFVAHYQSGATTLLLVPVLDTPAAYPGKAGKVSLFHIAMNPLLNAMVALQKNDIVSNEVLRTALSLLLLSSNVSAKIPTAAVDYEAQIAVLKKLLVGSLSASPVGQDVANVDLLLIILRDTRVWAQLAAVSAGDATELSVENFASLFRCFLRTSGSSSGESSTSSNTDRRLEQVSALLQSASVTDNSMIREAVVSALLTEWKALQSSKNSSVVQRGMFLCSAFRKLPEEFLFTARSFSSDLFAHLAESFSMLASSNSLNAAEKTVLQQSADYAASVLLGLARNSQYSRLTVQDRVSSGSTAQPSAEAKAVEVLSAILLSAGSVRPCSDGEAVMAALQERLPVVLKLADHFLSSGYASQQGSVGTLLSLQFDAFLSHLLEHLRNHEEKYVEIMFQQAWSGIAKLVLQASTVGGGNVFCTDETKRLFRTVLNVLLTRSVSTKTSAEEVSGVQALMLGAVHQLLSDLIHHSPAEIAVVMGKAKSSRKSSGGSNSSSTAPVWTDARFHFIAECVSTVATLYNPRNTADVLPVASVRGLSEPDVSVLIHALLEHTAGIVDAVSVPMQQQEGWLRLFDILSSPLLLHTGVVTLPQSSMAESASTRLELSTQSVVIHSGKLSTLLRLLAHVMSAHPAAAVSVAEEEGNCSAQSLAVLSLLSGVLYFTLRCRMCNLESAQILEIFRVSLLNHMKPCQSTAVCRDLLVYYTEHGRKLLTAGSKEAHERFQKFHDELTSMVVSFYQQSVTVITNDSMNIMQITLILQQAHVITTAATSALQRQGRSGARRKNKENDTKSSSVFRFDIWFDGLFVLLSLATSHMHSWHSAHTVQKNRRHVSEIDLESDNNCTLNNAATVLLTKALLQNLERVIAVSSSCALPNLNTSVGAVSTLLTSCIALLLGIEHQLPTATATVVMGVSTHSMHSQTQQLLRMNLSSCYHLLCRVCGNIGSSQVLEKHIHFLASAVVETLSKASLTRSFQEIAMPGVFALFEKCQSRQKTQMFAMLDAQSRALMTDLHGEFMRSFKFVGK